MKTLKQHILVLLIASLLAISSLGIGMLVIDGGANIVRAGAIKNDGGKNAVIVNERTTEREEYENGDTCFSDITVFKYYDENGDGIYDEGLDEPISDWTFELYGKGYNGGAPGDWTYLANGTTGPDGYYVFEDWECGTPPGPMGHYKVREYLPDGWYNTGSAVYETEEEYDNTVFSNSELELTDEHGDEDERYVEDSFWLRENPMTAEFGNARMEGDIDVYKFHDVNYDSNYDEESEDLIDGFTFQLWSADEEGNATDPIGKPVKTEDGMYTFEDLVPGNYVVQEIIPETGEEECCWTTTTGILNHVVVENDETVEAWFGNVHGGSIEGMKFLDIVADGYFDVGTDKPLMSWTINLWENIDGEPGEEPIMTTETNRCGEYTFECVTPGDYFVQEVMQEGWYAVDSEIVEVSVEPCETTEDVDFANCMYKDIYGIKYYDWNTNGEFDEGDEVIPGWEIKLLNEEREVIKTTTTQECGYYFFDDLKVGTYYVEEEEREGWNNTTPTNVRVELTCCNSCKIVNFGNYELPEITIVKYNDTNMDAEYDMENEYLVDSQVLFDIEIDGLYSETLGVTGEWSFYVDIGDYTITEQLPQGWLNTTPLEQMNSLGPGDHWLVEFGNVQYGNITVYKFYDLNMNEQWDEGEKMLEGWDMTLFNSTGVKVNSGTTDAEGMVVFEEIVPGNYTVIEDLQKCWFNTTLIEQEVTVEAGEEEQVWFGNVPGGYIEGYKFCDYNMNQEFDGIEEGLEGWTINLYEYEENDNDYHLKDMHMRSTTTDGDGYYEFMCVKPGMYILEEEMQHGWHNSTSDYYLIEVGPDGELEYNFGNYRFGDITGIKYYDFNMNGTFEPDEGDIPLRGRTVELWEADVDGNMTGSEPIDSTETDMHGYYIFEDIGPGDYVVYQPKPCCDWIHTTPREVHVRMGCLEKKEVNYGEYKLSSIDVYEIGGTAGVGVEIYESDENGVEGDLLESGETGDHGWYISEQLEPGYYLVVLEDGQEKLVQLRMGEQVEFDYSEEIHSENSIEATYAKFE